MKLNGKEISQITVSGEDGEVLAVITGDGKIIEKDGISVVVEFAQEGA